MKTTRPTERGLVLLLVAFASAAVLAGAEARPDEEDEEPAVSDVSDSPTARIPAVTRFPKYPAEARRDRIEGAATVCFKIAPNGRILDPRIASSTHRIFEKPALRAIRESSFEPLGPDEQVSAIPVCRTFRFRLDPVAQPAGA